jgi:hypothetical protein
LAAEGARTSVDGCLQDTPLKPACQAISPESWLIRSYLIKTLVFQRYADILLICVGFVEEFGYGWN